MLDLTKKFGKPICVVLYSVFSYFAAKKKPTALLLLFTMHLCEYFTVAHKLAEEKEISQLSAFANCLSFGFTWWLPIKKA